MPRPSAGTGRSPQDERDKDDLYRKRLLRWHKSFSFPKHLLHVPRAFDCHGQVGAVAVVVLDDLKEAFNYFFHPATRMTF